MQQADAVHKQSMHVPGLSAPVDILIDRYGIPHIYASNDADVFLAQGFNAARDRLWQLDLWRRRGLGLLAEVFGPAFVERDRAARLLLYRGDMAAEWAAYGEQTKDCVTSFAHGINAYIRLLRAEPERLPIEFVAAGFQPGLWSPEDVLRNRAHARVRNLDTEITRANVAATHGLEQAARVKQFNPPWPLRYPEGCKGEAIPAEVLATYRLATTLVDFSGAQMNDDLDQVSALDGSNNWAVRPERSSSGRALLATDPHRLQELPSLRYTVHLNAPGLNVIGAGEPAVPGVSLGHNEHIAFGLTIFPTDQEDLYVYELDPNDSTRYRYGDGFESMRETHEKIPVRGADDREVTLRFTRHGPLLHIDAARQRAYALRTVWTEPGTAAYLASLRYQRARCWDDFVAAQSSWGAPSVNHVYADIEGNIGWITAGKIPARPNWDGVLPVPGDGRFEWQGFMPDEHHPREYNPPRQWVGSANHMNLPADFDHASHKTGFEFASGGRFERITQVMESRAKHSLDDFARLQADVQCQEAKRLISKLASLPPFEGEAAKARAMLGDWDFELSIESATAALFEIWFRRHVIPCAMRSASLAAVIAMIEVADVDPLIQRFIEQATHADWEQTLKAAWSQTCELLGTDTNVWAWGTLHQVSLQHPLSKVFGAQLARRLDIGPLPKSGSALTVNNNGYRPADFSVHHGVSWRMLADVGNWDACRVINSPGQSGDPASPHYADHFPLWAREEYVPLLFSRAAIEEALERHIVLLPV
ncbi:MAG: penicillin amidase [Gammaproteobacteria bacterium]|jgi:penicillin amidase